MPLLLNTMPIQTQNLFKLLPLTACFMLMQGANAQEVVLDQVVAVVNKGVILQSELDQATAQAKAQLQSQNTPLPSEEVLRADVLDRLITRATQMDLIDQYKDQISSNQINAAMLELAKERGLDSLSALQQQLDAQNSGSYAQLREQMRVKIVTEQLKAQEMRRRINITQSDIDDFLISPESQNLYGTKYNTDHFRVSLPQNATAQQKQSALQAAQKVEQSLSQGESVSQALAQAKTQGVVVQGGNMGFHEQHSLPSYAKGAITRLEVGGVTQPILAADGYHVIRLADKQDEAQAHETQWNVQHILISTSSGRSSTQAQEQINQLYQQIDSGADFATLASTFSDDPGSAAKGGELGWVRAGQMVKPFEDTMKSTAVGSVSEPFETQYGWHVLKVSDKENKNITSELKRAQAEQILTERRSEQAADDWAQEIRTQSYVKVLEPSS